MENFIKFLSIKFCLYVIKLESQFSQFHLLAQPYAAFQHLNIAQLKLFWHHPTQG